MNYYHPSMISTLAKQKRKPPKYHNQKVEMYGRKFDSIRERNYFLDLCMLQKGGVVEHIECQVSFELIPKYISAEGKTIRALKYIADFVVLYSDGHTEIVDVKGYRTKEYQLKKKLFEYKYLDKGYFIKEV